MMAIAVCIGLTTGIAYWLIYAGLALILTGGAHSAAFIVLSLAAALMDVALLEFAVAVVPLSLQATRRIILLWLLSLWWSYSVFVAIMTLAGSDLFKDVSWSEIGTFLGYGPIVTFISATYDGSLFALLGVSAYGIWRRAHPERTGRALLTSLGLSAR